MCFELVGGEVYRLGKIVFGYFVFLVYIVCKVEGLMRTGFGGVEG